MAQKLLFNKLSEKLHIALFFLIALSGVQAHSQSVLLPGDVVIVSANADTRSVDFIPLIDVERGTILYFSNGLWNSTESTLDGSELKLTFEEEIPAGTNIHINTEEDPRFTKDGELDFEGETHRLFAYQKEKDGHRFIFAMGWGKGGIWSKDELTESGSDIPASLTENSGTLLTLGEEPNQQYYIRNGASGTRNMLLSFIGEPDNWRGTEKNTFSRFGTSFNLKTPPVIQFQNSITSVSEDDSSADLTVSIYEHDGSRISVDLEFDSLRSIATPGDFQGFTSKTINFTGLVGDFDYTFNIPITDDDVYEGLETGIFTLANLSRGNFGDFLSHNLVIEDNEQPEVIIARVANGKERSGFIEIKNMEESAVSMKGWTLSGKNLIYEFSEDALLMPDEILKWLDSSESLRADSTIKVISSGLKARLLSNEGGILTLKNLNGKIVHQVRYSQFRSSQNENSRRTIAVRELAQSPVDEGISQNQINQSIAALQVNNSGWKALSGINDFDTAFSEKAFYTWNEGRRSFQNINDMPGSGLENTVVLGFFDDKEIETLTTHVSSSMEKTAPAEGLSFSVSATDGNENEVVDGLEGLNLVFNNLDKPVAVQSFIELARAEYPELSISESIYGIKQRSSGALEFEVLDGDMLIAPRSPFWIMLESPFPNTDLLLSKDELKESIVVGDDSESDRSEKGLFELTLKTQSQDQVLKVNFTEARNTDRVKDLNSYPELFLPDQSFLNFSVKEGNDFYNELTMFSAAEQTITLPIHLSSSEGGRFTFSVTEWDEIPTDLQITLVDSKTDKEYNLRKDFSVTVDLNFTASNSNRNNEGSLSKTQYREDERFVIKMKPSASVEKNEEGITDKPRQLELHQNYPNPFNPVTTISFYLPESEEVRLSVFNIVGQPVAVIVDGTLSVGQHQFDWDATDKPSGMYIYQLEVGNSVMTRKMTLVK
ncbi:MAG: T9SS type A sorting domain-containing protein [Gracilimonas sp.]